LCTLAGWEPEIPSASTVAKGKEWTDLQRQIPPSFKQLLQNPQFKNKKIEWAKPISCSLLGCSAY
jgi:hypothetical protein